MADGRILDAIDLLHAENAVRSTPDVERRLAVLRNQALAHLEPASRFDEWPVPVPVLDEGPPCVPQLRPEDLDAEAVRAAIASHGGVHVPGLLDAGQVAAFVEGIDRVLEFRDQNRATPLRPLSSWFDSLPLPPDQAGLLSRPWVAAAGGLLACDSPKLLDLMFATYEAVGLRDVVTGYLGERPVLSANKATLRRHRPEGGTDWHQDGAFLGAGIRVLNVWVALTDCGVDAPGMDLVPRRFEEVHETGTGGAFFDWSVGPDVVADLAADAPVVRPRFAAGDAMLFDELYLHRTALDPGMTRTRHAIESWFFAPTSYPDGQVPLVW